MVASPRSLTMQNNSVPRTGDRLWYEEETGGLTPPQLEAVKQVSLDIYSLSTLSKLSTQPINLYNTQPIYISILKYVCIR